MHHWSGILLSVHLFVCPVASRSQRVSLIVIPFCLSVWMAVGHSATYSLPRLIDHNQIWSAGIYLSSDPCKPFWIPYLPYSRCQREKYAKFRLGILLPLRTWRLVPYHLSLFLYLYSIHWSTNAVHIYSKWFTGCQHVYVTADVCAGCDRHLFGLQLLALSQGLELPQLFTDKAYSLRSLS